ncbi:MAG: sigma-54-dependent Fis family transcriptional regulator [Phycisphaerae bacterium]|nr:sigma-54-dependent Fis family transcriptional regulator [Phycisphaerae bacterium]
MGKTENQERGRMQQRSDNATVLIVDNEPQTIRLMLELLAQRGISARLATTKKGAIDALDRTACDLAFLSEQTADPQDRSSAFELLGAIRAVAPEMPVVMMGEATESTADWRVLQRSTQAAVRAIQAGCRDFLLKPLDRRTVEGVLDAALPNRSVATAAAAREGDRCLYQIVGRSPRMLQVVSLAERIAPTSVPVLISGESGTGKELLSLLIHHKSRRALGPFVRVNCAAMSDSLLESELFGHEKGSFTGAYTQRKGRFEMAHGGTLLLDEISETSLTFQAKLLRIIEQQEFERVGGNENIRVNVRIISTTNRDLLHEVQMGRFRQDLYYRLSATRIVAAPLRERRDDLRDLIWYFVNLYAREAQRRIETIDPTMLDIFANYHWPGNVRQLRNVVITSLTLGAGPVLSLADVSWLFDELQPLTQHSVESGLHSVRRTSSVSTADTGFIAGPTGLGGIRLDEIERQAILQTLRQTSGNQTRAARVLGISDRTLREKIRRYRQQEDAQTCEASRRAGRSLQPVS